MIKLSEEEKIMERRKRKNGEEWARIVREQERSGMTAAAFCRRENVRLSSFYHWKRRLSENGKPKVAKGKEPFIDMGRIGASGMSATGSLEVTLELGDGARLTLRRG
jgi:transposase-like protein